MNNPEFLESVQQMRRGEGYSLADYFKENGDVSDH
jgi:hypothetical protein